MISYYFKTLIEPTTLPQIKKALPNMHYVNSANINNLITSHIDNDYNSL